MPSTDDHGNVAAVKGGITNSKVLVHLARDGKRTDNVLPWKISLGTNFGPSSARLSPDGRRSPTRTCSTTGPTTAASSRGWRSSRRTRPGHPTQPMIDQPGWEMPTWIDGKLVVAKNGVALLEMEPLPVHPVPQSINAGFRIVSTEVSRNKGRYLVDLSRTADNAPRPRALRPHRRVPRRHGPSGLPGARRTARRASRTACRPTARRSRGRTTAA